MSDIKLYQDDLPRNFRAPTSAAVAIDTETMGLQPNRDRLCLVQLCFGDARAHLVQFTGGGNYKAPNLRKLLADKKRRKIMHYGRFDMAVIYKNLEIMPDNVFCTKIASRLTRTFTDRHGLAALCRDMLGVELSKQQQSSDWGSDDLTDKQLAYAAADVLHLHALSEALEALLRREGRDELARACFDFLPVRARLDLLGWENADIFSHS